MPDAPLRHGQHRDLPGSTSMVPPRAPTPGPISVGPTDDRYFIDAIEAGGGVVAPLGPETRGFVWLDPGRGDELAAVLRDHPGIEWVQLPWAGVDKFLGVFSEIDPGGFPVFTSAKGTYSEPVAEHALALILGLFRELPSKARDAHWQAKRTGLSLFGNRVVIVGAGGITVELLRLLEPFRVDSTVVRRGDTPLSGAMRTVSVDRLREVLRDADVVVLAAASTPDTCHLIGEAELAILPPHAVIVNVARGALLDDDAALRALREDRLWGLGLDVTEPEPLPDDHPLWSEPRCVITSHSADTPLMTASLLATRIETNVRAFLAGESLVGLVDPRAGY